MALLVELDEHSGEGCAQQRGPFSVFSVVSSPETQDTHRFGLPNRKIYLQSKTWKIHSIPHRTRLTH
ncbi:hypothetical protein PITC_098440 [Penicillium italicum]|uniref:Uncharacterized protein n=1 Tax=Penicillium italicum TaxID=40296 RepID=A0A0A2L1Q1_PENIT|nr:hypothetical protein PITC_098440 [Penicillium italicum]